MSFSAIGFVTCFALVMSPSFAQTQGGCGQEAHQAALF